MLRTLEIYISLVREKYGIIKYVGLLVEDGKVIGTSPTFYKSIDELLAVNIQEYQGLLSLNDCKLIHTIYEDRNPECFV